MLEEAKDTFHDIARYYDRIMDHVDYDRWFMVTTELAKLLPKGFRHVDAACGTGTLLKMLRSAGWASMGLDLSPAMLRAARKSDPGLPVAAADLRALPLHEEADYITCLFDSMNFLLTVADLEETLRQFHQALTPNGIVYFDVVTERMVADHYEDQSWEETTGRLTTSWDNHYDRNTRVIETAIRVNTGPVCRLQERIYPLAEVERAVERAGLHLLVAYDAHSWKKPNRKTVRIDFIAAKANPRPLRKPFRAIRDTVRGRC